MNPKKIGKLVPAPGQQWKAPLPEFIAHCYEKSHGRRTPEKILSLEQVIENEEKRKEARRERKTSKRECAALNSANLSAPAQVQHEA